MRVPLGVAVRWHLGVGVIDSGRSESTPFNLAGMVVSNRRTYRCGLTSRMVRIWDQRRHGSQLDRPAPLNRAARRAGPASASRIAGADQAAARFSLQTFLVWPFDVVRPAKPFELLDEPGVDVDLTLEYAVTCAGGVGMVEVVPGSGTQTSGSVPRRRPPSDWRRQPPRTSHVEHTPVRYDSSGSPAACIASAAAQPSPEPGEVAAVWRPRTNSNSAAVPN